MSSHPSLDTGLSQCALVLAELQLHPGEWVPMPRLVLCSGSYNVHSRIADLRKRGHAILHKNTRKPGSKTIQSFYQLTPPPSPSPSPSASSAPSAFRFSPESQTNPTPLPHDPRP